MRLGLSLTLRTRALCKSSRWAQALVFNVSDRGGAATVHVCLAAPLPRCRFARAHCVAAPTLLAHCPRTCLPHSQGQATRKHDSFVWLDGQCDYKYLIHTAGFSYSGGERPGAGGAQRVGAHVCMCLTGLFVMGRPPCTLSPPIAPSQASHTRFVHDGLRPLWPVSSPPAPPTASPHSSRAGLKYKMACGSMVFKFDSTYQEFFEPALQVLRAGRKGRLWVGAPVRRWHSLAWAGAAVTVSFLNPPPARKQRPAFVFPLLFFAGSGACGEAASAARRSGPSIV